MGVFRVSRGKAVYLYVKNRDVKKYIRVTDSEGQLLPNHKELESKAVKLDSAAKPGTGTRYLYLIRSTNKTYGYEQLAFRAQPKGHPSKLFRVDKHGYRDAFLNAKGYLTSLGFECNDIPNPSRYKELIVAVRGELGYRSILREYKNAEPESETEEALRAVIYGKRRRVRRVR